MDLIEVFNYGSLPHAAILEGYATAIRETMVDAIDIVGDQLIKAKELLPHGMWEAWLQHHFNMTRRTADNYINATKQIKDSPILERLPKTALYLLTHAPQEAKEEITEKLGQGEKLSAPQARIIITKHKTKTKTR